MYVVKQIRKMSHLLPMHNSEFKYSVTKRVSRTIILAIIVLQEYHARKRKVSSDHG